MNPSAEYPGRASSLPAPSMAAPSLPARVLQQLRAAAGELPRLLLRAARAATARAATLLRHERGATVADPQPLSEQPPVAAAEPATSTMQAAPRAGLLRLARASSVGVGVLMAAASAVGLWWEDLYQDPAATVAMFRGYDLVSLTVATPVLAGALVRARHGSPRAQLLWAAMLAYASYTYAYYVFGAAFNALFLVHLALLFLAVVALVLVLANLDVPRVAAGFGARTPVRTVGALLAFLAAALGGMWTYYALRFAVTGAAPEQGLLVQPPPILRLGYVLDLLVLVPGYAAAAVLLWRRHRWGYVLATVLLAASGVVQLDYMVALLSQAVAGVPGATAVDPQEPFIAVAILAAAAALLANSRPAPSGPLRGSGPGWR